MIKFNRVRISQADFNKGKPIPCVYWQTDALTMVEIRRAPINAEHPSPGVILDLDWPLAAQPVNQRKETLC